MGGLISAEFKKLFKGKTLIVCIVIAVILGAVMSSVYYNAWIKNAENIIMTREFLTGMGMDTETIDESFSALPSENSLWSYVTTMLGDGSIIYFAAVTVCVYIASEYTMGTFKNTVSRGFSRVNIYLSKLLVSSVSTVLVSLAYVLGGCGISLTFIDQNSDISLGNALEILGIYLILLISLSAFYMMLSVIFNKTGIAVAAAVIIPTLITAILNIATMSDKELGKISRYLLVDMFTYVKQGCAKGEGWIMLLIALAYFAVSTSAGMFIFSKKEIK